MIKNSLPAGSKTNSYVLLGGLILLTCALLFVGLGRGVLYFDEAIYAEVSKEMVESGSWLTPHWNGRLWFQKPPLYFWVTGFLFKIFGVSEFWARFASAGSATGVLLLCYLIARGIYGQAAGVLAVLILLSTQLFVFYGRFGTTDTMLTLFILLAVYGYLRSEDDERFWVLVGTGCAMALMVKGAAGVVAPVTLLLATVLDKRIGSALRSKWLWTGLAVGVLIVIPWHLLMYWQHGKAFVNDYLSSNVVSRAKSNLSEYQRGYGYYFSVLRDFFSPWVYILPFALIFGRTARTTVVLLLGLLVFVLYTLVQTKFQWYILPAIPAFAIIIAGFIGRFIKNRTRLQLALGALALLLIWGFGVFRVIRLIRLPEPEMEAGARLARLAAQDQRPIMAYPENLEMTVKFYSGRELCTDPVISKLSHNVITECKNSGPTHIIVRTSDINKVDSVFTVNPELEYGPLTYARIARR